MKLSNMVQKSLTQRTGVESRIITKSANEAPRPKSAWPVSTWLPNGWRFESQTLSSARAFIENFKAKRRDTKYLKKIKTKALKHEARILAENCNPINSQNFQIIKNRLIHYVKTTFNHNTKYMKLISKASDPAELFSVFNKLLNDINTTDLFDSENKIFKKMLKLRSIITTKSQNPEVIRLEQIAKKLGVQIVHFADDKKQAKKTIEALQEIITGGIPIPTSICVNNLMPEYVSGAAISIFPKGCRKSFIFLTDSIRNETFKSRNSNSLDFIKHTEEFAKLSEKEKIRVERLFTRSIEKSTSTTNDKHSIYHEIAHTFQPKKHIELSEEEREIAKEISKYAGIKPEQEAMPEMFAMLMDGQNLTLEQMALYKKLGGLVPRNHPQYSLP